LFATVFVVLSTLLHVSAYIGHLQVLRIQNVKRTAVCNINGSVTITNKNNKLHGLSPRANYTDRATAASRRSDCQLLRIKGCHVVSVTDPYGRILGFLDSSRYFSIKYLPVVLTRLSGPRSRPINFFSGNGGNRTRAFGSVAKNADH
jgi:hypothetical protein